MTRRSDVPNEVTLNGKRGRGRPAKSDALTQAERAKRYREKRKAMRDIDNQTRDDTAVTDKALLGQLLKLQMKYDLEHLAVVQLQTELATVRQAMKKPTVNPLASQVAALKKTVAEQEKIISAYGVEINRLRDECRKGKRGKGQA